jgi:hypothetical protein
MKLFDLLNEMVNEKIHVQKPNPTKPLKGDFEDPEGYIVTGREIDPVTGRTGTELAPEPPLLKYAREVYRMKKGLKYFELLPGDDEISKYFKAEASSIKASLHNAEGKLRDLHNKMQIAGKFKE